MYENIQWSYIKGTNKGYILLSTGKVFSKDKCDFLKQQKTATGTIFYRLKFDDGIHTISLNKLLKENF